MSKRRLAEITLLLVYVIILHSANGQPLDVKHGNVTDKGKENNETRNKSVANDAHSLVLILPEFSKNLGSNTSRSKDTSHSLILTNDITGNYSSENKSTPINGSVENNSDEEIQPRALSLTRLNFPNTICPEICVQVNCECGGLGSSYPSKTGPSSRPSGPMFPPSEPSLFETQIRVKPNIPTWIPGPRFPSPPTNPNNPWIPNRTADPFPSKGGTPTNPRNPWPPNIPGSLFPPLGGTSTNPSNPWNPNSSSLPFPHPIRPPTNPSNPMMPSNPTISITQTQIRTPNNPNNPWNPNIPGSSFPSGGRPSPNHNNPWNPNIPGSPFPSGGRPSPNPNNPWNPNNPGSLFPPGGWPSPNPNNPWNPNSPGSPIPPGGIPSPNPNNPWNPNNPGSPVPPVGRPPNNPNDPWGPLLPSNPMMPSNPTISISQTQINHPQTKSSGCPPNTCPTCVPC